MAGEADAVLVVRSGVDDVERVALDQPRQVIGRRVSIHTILDNQYMSGSHAEIARKGGQYSTSLT